MTDTKDHRLKICFAASSGGHFEQIMRLKPLMDKYDSFLITDRLSARCGRREDLLPASSEPQGKKLSDPDASEHIGISENLSEGKTGRCNLHRSSCNDSDLPDR